MDEKLLECYSLKKLIGKGGFAEVYLAIERATQSPVAIKCLAKTRILRPVKRKNGVAKTPQEEKDRRRIAGVMLERNILCQFDSPFLVTATTCFQTATHLFIVMPYYGGGDLHRYLDVFGAMSEDFAKFCAAEIVMGLEYLHSQRIVFRDLKPGNVLLDRLGHIRLCDFGLCAELREQQQYLTQGRAGTRGFRAPEVVRKESYSYSCDFFSLGVCLYQLLTGKKMFGKSGVSFRTVRSFKGMSADAVSLIEGLTQLQVLDRLGCKLGQEGWQAVKLHPFFASINWMHAAQRLLDAPFVPSSQYRPYPTKFKQNKHDKKRKLVKDLTIQQQALFADFDFQCKIRVHSLPSDSPMNDDVPQRSPSPSSSSATAVPTASAASIASPPPALVVSSEGRSNSPCLSHHSVLSSRSESSSARDTPRAPSDYVAPFHAEPNISTFREARLPKKLRARLKSETSSTGESDSDSSSSSDFSPTFALGDRKSVV